MDINKLISPLLIIISILVLLVLGIYFLFAYNPGDPEKSDDFKKTGAEENESRYTIDNASKTMKEVARVTMKTNFGKIELELFKGDAPKTVDNFIKLSSTGFYNGTKFHRVIKGFMIQGGDPLSKNNSSKDQWGTGGPGYKFEDEIHANNKNVIGTISMANAGPDTNGSQFFINTADNDFLDTKHTVFGRVIKGMDIIAKIENTPTEGSDRPRDDVIIETIIIN